MRIIFSLEWPPSAKLLLESPDGVIKPLQSAQMSERFSKLRPNSERWRQRSKKNYDGAHFRCYSVFKMSQLLSNESQKLSQVCHILTKVSQRENAALASTAPGSCLTLCLCATLSILPATFCFSTTSQHCLTLRTLFQHFAAHLGFVRPSQYSAIFCFSSTPQHCSCPTLRTLSFLLLYNSATLLMFNSCFTLWLCAAFVVRNKFWSQRRSKLTPVCALSARLE